MSALHVLKIMKRGGGMCTGQNVVEDGKSLQIDSCVDNDVRSQT